MKEKSFLQMQAYDSIKNGIVIDHITAGKGMELYRLLKLDQLDCSVALIKNAVSQKMGKKDIIKVEWTWTFWATWIPASRWPSSGTERRQKSSS